MSGLSRREWRAQQAAALPAFLGGAAQPEERQLTILTVCTGNICRSALADVVLRARLASTDVRVHSAGTHALVGHGMPAPSQEIALAAGAAGSDVQAHSARYLVEPHLQGADLVLAMSREHRSHAVKMVPSRMRRTFTVREFARLANEFDGAELSALADAAGDAPTVRLAAIVDAVAARRGITAVGDDEDDVIDPYRRSRATYERSAAQLLPALDEVERVIRAALG